jgi:hypothetical protein
MMFTLKTLSASTAAIILSLASTPFARGIPSGVPSFAIDYAPLVYLFAGENYNPADIGAQLPPNTTPRINFTTVPNAPDPLTLNNLARLPSSVSLSSVGDFTNFSSQPSFLYGVEPESSGQTGDAVSCAIIVNDHASSTDPALRNVTDVFYMYFYAFDYGGDYFGFNVGNHVGDWEHTMVRFVNATPSAMWFSQHSNGEAFTYQAVEKGRDGKRVRLLFLLLLLSIPVCCLSVPCEKMVARKEDNREDEEIKKGDLQRKKKFIIHARPESLTLPISSSSPSPTPPTAPTPTTPSPAFTTTPSPTSTSPFP